MSKKVEHITIDGIEKKWCSRCEQYLPLNLFHASNGHTWDNKCYLCANCINKKRQNNPRICALHSWVNMCERVKKDVRYTRKGIKIKIEKSVFIDWYIKHWFKRCRVDRINNEGHYEIGNIQLISLLDHNFKRRSDKLAKLGIKEPYNMRYCYRCETLKHYDEFYKKKRKVSRINPLGLSEDCKECEKEQTRTRYRMMSAKDMPGWVKYMRELMFAEEPQDVVIEIRDGMEMLQCPNGMLVELHKGNLASLARKHNVFIKEEGNDAFPYLPPRECHDIMQPWLKYEPGRRIATSL